jgi:hypothetical protein
VSDHAAKARAVQFIETALVVGKLTQFIPAFVTRFGPPAIIGLENKAEIDAESVFA